jgi:hypothetical protein
MFLSLQSGQVISSSRGRVVAFGVFVLCGFLLLSCSKRDKRPISNETGGPHAESSTPPPAAPQEKTTVASAEPAALPASAAPETLLPPSTAAPHSARLLARRRMSINTDEILGKKASVPTAVFAGGRTLQASDYPGRRTRLFVFAEVAKSRRARWLQERFKGS